LLCLAHGSDIKVNPTWEMFVKNIQ
jgi:hypothetical protein